MIRAILISIIILINLCLTDLVNAQTPLQIRIRFFKDIRASNVETALDKLYKQHPQREKRQAELDSLKQAFKIMSSDLGEYVGSNHLSERNIHRFFREVTCLVRFSERPIIVYFQFYRPTLAPWKFYSISFDTNLERFVRPPVPTCDQGD